MSSMRIDLGRLKGRPFSFVRRCPYAGADARGYDCPWDGPTSPTAQRRRRIRIPPTPRPRAPERPLPHSSARRTNPPYSCDPISVCGRNPLASLPLGWGSPFPDGTPIRQMNGAPLLMGKPSLPKYVNMAYLSCNPPYNHPLKKIGQHYLPKIFFFSKKSLFSPPSSPYGIPFRCAEAAGWFEGPPIQDHRNISNRRPGDLNK